MGRWTEEAKEVQQEMHKLNESINKLAGKVKASEQIVYSSDYELTRAAITSSNYTTDLTYQRKRTVGEVSELPSVHDKIINLLEEFNESGEVDEKKMYELVEHILIAYNG